MRKSRPWPVGLAWLAVWLAGCGGNSDESYVPGSSSAQEALQLALEAWKSGQPADPVGKSPSGATIRAIDMDWAAGRRLSAFEILQELPPAAEAGPRQFVVQLTLDGMPQPIEATYLVVGIDPLQVFRDKDYDLYFGAPAEPALARTALEKALDCWRLRITPEELRLADPPVAMTDKDWVAGRRLIEFQLLPGEVPAGSTIRWPVRLRVVQADGREASIDVHYVIRTSPSIHIARGD